MNATNYESGEIKFSKCWPGLYLVTLDGHDTKVKIERNSDLSWCVVSHRGFFPEVIHDDLDSMAEAKQGAENFVRWGDRCL